MFLKLLRSLIFTCTVILCGCVNRTGLIPPPVGEKLSDSAAAQIMEKIRSCESQVNSFRGLARAELEQGKERNSFRYAIVFSKPDRLRLETLPNSAVYTLSLLVTSGNEMTFLDSVAKTAHQGPVDMKIIKRFLGMPMLPFDLMALLTACPSQVNMLDGESDIFLNLEQHSLQVRGRGVVFEVDSESLQARRVYLTNNFNDKIAVVVQWSEFRDIQGVTLPAKVEISVPELKLILQLRFSTSEVNGDYPQRLFEAEIPQDFELQK